MQKEYYGVLCIFIAIYILITAMRCRNRKEAIAGVTGKICLFGVGMVLLYAVTMLTNHRMVMSVCFSLLCVIIEIALLLMLDYTLQLAGYGQMKRWQKTIGGVMVAINSIFLLSNPWTGEIIKYDEITYHGDLYLEIVPEGWFLVHFGFSYIIVLAVLFLIGCRCRRIPFVYSGRYWMEAFVLLLVSMFNLLFLFSKVILDISYVLFGMITIVIYWITFEYRPKLFVRAYARYLLMDKLQEPVVLFDINDRLADFNKEAAEKFELTSKDLDVMTRKHFVEDILQLTYQQNVEECRDREVVYQKEYAEYVYCVRGRKLYSRRGLDMGSLYAFYDITKQKMMYSALEKASMYHMLTSFYSSRTFYQKLAEQDKERMETVVAVCKITNLKLLNVVYGRKAGDKVIQIMSEELRKVLPEDALVAVTEESRVLIATNSVTEAQLGMYLTTAARKVKKNAMTSMPVYLVFGVARRENTAVASEEYIKYAELDLLLQVGKEELEQRRLMTKAMTRDYFANGYESEEHVKRITGYAIAMAEKLGLSEMEKKKLELLCCYHDIGRWKTREEVWGRAATITRDEFDIMKLHSVTGYQIVSELEIEFDISELVLYHHENFDGSGYPYGLRGEQIPLLVRIFAIVDSYDVMVNEQRYKEAVTKEEACAELKAKAGVQFDPALVTLFEQCLRESK